jgi:hypothetical protein
MSTAATTATMIGVVGWKYQRLNLDVTVFQAGVCDSVNADKARETRWAARRRGTLYHKVAHLAA